eukprot:scaffold2075_cov444-Prasinococcus_capsulatus_cf.AAC.5
MRQQNTPHYACRVRGAPCRRCAGSSVKSSGAPGALPGEGLHRGVLVTHIRAWASRATRVSCGWR